MDPPVQLCGVSFLAQRVPMGAARLKLRRGADTPPMQGPNQMSQSFVWRSALKKERLDIACLWRHIKLEET
jgi:hypothetical protein